VHTTFQNSQFAVRNSSRGLPRGVDVAVALVGLLLTSPLLVVSAVLVGLTSSGGIFFRQRRVGQFGRTFDLYKLRTMRSSNGGPQVTSGDDSRITRAGRFLRKTKLDELPTLWNVLKGDMALVGPRPEVPRYVKLDEPDWQLVLATRPGLTDPVTVRLRNEEALLAQINGDRENYYLSELQPLKLKGYVAYLERRSWRSDLKVLWQTAAEIILPRDLSTDF
jgi:lipopolysaccharide/colanic/teichoic acid biosynthesis glycosyltransferase